MPSITSIQNPRIKNAAKLRQRRQRDRQQRFLIDGVREIAKAHTSDIAIDEVFYCGKMVRDDESRALVEQLKADNVDTSDVVKPVFMKLAYGERCDGVVAIARTPQRSLAEFKLPESAVLVVIEGVEKPGNIGAVLRTADAVGADGVLLAGGGTDVWNPNTIRASLGTLFTLNVLQAATDETIAWLATNNFRTLATHVDAELLYTNADYTGRVAIALGSEADGLTPAWHEAGATPIRLPMLGTADSLNVSATSAVVLYEALRHRKG